MDTFDCAAAALLSCRAVLRRINPDDLPRPTPCAEYTVADVGGHLLRSMSLLASVAGQQTGPPEAGTLEDRVAVTARAALAAWRHRGLAGSVAVGRTITPAHLAAEIIPLELLVHGWDLTTATGGEIQVPAEVAEHVLGCARELITADKRGRSFAAEVPAGATATALQQLVAFTGRQP